MKTWKCFRLAINMSDPHVNIPVFFLNVNISQYGGGEKWININYFTHCLFWRNIGRIRLIPNFLHVSYGNGYTGASVNFSLMCIGNFWHIHKMCHKWPLGHLSIGVWRSPGPCSANQSRWRGGRAAPRCGAALENRGLEIPILLYV